MSILVLACLQCEQYSRFQNLFNNRDHTLVVEQIPLHPLAIRRLSALLATQSCTP